MQRLLYSSAYYQTHSPQSHRAPYRHGVAGCDKHLHGLLYRGWYSHYGVHPPAWHGMQAHGYRALAAALWSQRAAHASHHRDDDYADAPVLVFVLQVHDYRMRAARAVVVPQRAAVLPAQQCGHAAVNYYGAQVISSPQR
jgi:hypothetical protein